MPLVLFGVTPRVTFERLIMLECRDAWKAFDYADAEVKGCLTKHRYKVAMTAVFGCCPDKEEVKRVFGTCSEILYEEFEYWVSRKCHEGQPRVNAEVLFTLLDKDYKGELVLEDFVSASRSVGINVSLSVWRKVFRELDRRERGYLQLEEFLDVIGSLSENISH